MKTTGGDVLVETLIAWGVNTVFGLPGDGINGIMEALRKRQDKIRFIHVRHEESAAFMACAYAKFTGKLGCCLATSGPGGIHLLNGLYDAKMDGQPVIAVTGSHYSDLSNTFAQQDVELDKLFMDVAGYNVRVMGPSHIENATSLACRYALSRSSVAHVTIATDFQSIEVSDAHRSKRNVPSHVSNVFARKAGLPDEEDLLKAARVINSGKKIAILAGRGALDATDELERLADKLSAPIIKALLGKAAVPDESPFTTGAIGILGTAPSQKALEECDTLLIIGSSFPYMEFYPQPGKVKAVQIDVDAVRIGLRYPVEVGLVGDSKKTLLKLLPMLNTNSHTEFLEEIQDEMKQWRKLMHERGTRKDVPMKPQVVAHELGSALPANAIVTCDTGTVTSWFARYIPAKRGQMFSLSGNLATMANGLPYAIAAQLAYPGRQVVAFVGDGGFSMLMAELSTCVKYKLPVKIVILKNNSLGEIKWEQMVYLGNPEYGVGLEPIDFALFAKSCGAAGFSIKDPGECGNIMQKALKTRGPVVIEAEVDPFEPPSPPKLTLKETKNFAKALAKGEPHRGKLALTLASDKVREMI
ncbi:MAG: pyruvate oxidase [Ignavibacteria bacterium]|jgi:pyruvate dehydrogenase (quinone)/pyruvate oxidase|nr:pyruvate oxidase [Ignavibacteria bacterium]MCU7504891.1 pyruvate oxidase [Ignavibacteria bacterium]MCU7517848.1 pyruvate oxidase [Ignavibacteria bacterium]